MALFPLCTQPHATRRISVGSISAYARDRASNGLPRSGILFVGLLEIEWAILGGQSGEKAGGHGLLRAWSGAEIRHHERCRNQARDSVVCRTGIRSRAFELARAFVAYSVIQMCGSSRSIGAQKNDL